MALANVRVNFTRTATGLRWDYYCFTCGTSAYGYGDSETAEQLADEHRRTCPSSQGATDGG